jgi:hypothetical protein
MRARMQMLYVCARARLPSACTREHGSDRHAPPPDRKISCTGSGCMNSRIVLSAISEQVREAKAHCRDALRAESKMEVMAAEENSPLLLAYIVVPLIVLAAGPAPCHYARACTVCRYSTTSIATDSRLAVGVWGCRLLYWSANDPEAQVSACMLTSATHTRVSSDAYPFRSPSASRASGRT